MIYDVIVVGGGAAGLYFAIKNKDLKVLILEKNSQFGEKLSITGGGRCNITQHGHYKDIAESFREAEKFVLPAISKLTPHALRNHLSSIGMETVVDDRFRVYPVHMDAQRVAKEFTELANAEKISNIIVTDIKKNQSGQFTVETDKGYFLSKCVLACGGGKTENGLHDIIERMGHSISPLQPALVGVLAEDEKLKELAGVSTIVKVSLSGTKREEMGEMMFTHNGLSGPVILDISTDVEHGSELTISFVNAKRGTIERNIIEYSVLSGGNTVGYFMSTLINYNHAHLPQRLRKALLSAAGIDPETRCGQLSSAKRKVLAQILTEYKVMILGSLGFENAMVTSGGVVRDEVDRKTMQSRKVDGLYFAGEILDVDGPTGGYNLHWAFASASLAYESISKRLVN